MSITTLSILNLQQGKPARTGTTDAACWAHHGEPEPSDIAAINATVHLFRLTPFRRWRWLSLRLHHRTASFRVVA